MEPNKSPSLNEACIDNFCLEKVMEILDPAAFDLISSFSMRAYVLIFLKNELLFNKRRNILEFGSGLSTIFLGLIIKKYKIKATITSVENDMKWINRLNEKVERLDLSNIVQLIFAPLTQVENGGIKSKWYDCEILERDLGSKASFDMVVIDGPPAYEKENKLNRLNAIPFIHNLLTDNYAIFLDDADRSGEQEIIELWQKAYKFPFNIYNLRTAICRKGAFSNSHPSLLIPTSLF